MEPQAKKAKLTNHFRVALRPYDVNVQRDIKKVANNANANANAIANHVHTFASTKNPSHPNALSQLNVNRDGYTKKVEVITIADDEDLKPTPQSLGPNLYNPPAGLPSAVHDYDQALLDDIRCEPHYAWDSFIYDRKREINFRTKSYLQPQPDPENRDPSERRPDLSLSEKCQELNPTERPQDITPLLRAELVDWLVNIQNYYALDHEALYMAVKIADQYLMRKTVSKNHLPLLYITAVLISAKYDERIPPVQIGDLIIQTRNRFRIKYSRKQVINFEADILVTLQFDIRFPLSYGFLRRFAQCTRSDKRTLTLARYILESSLLNYEIIEELESKLAAASLLLAFRMLHMDEAWNETAEFYTGYLQEDLLPLTNKLNDSISTMGGRHIRNKYSNEVFMSVARIPPLCQEIRGHLLRL